MNSEENCSISISENISRVRSAIKAACERAGRDPGDVTLIAVSKTKPFSDILEALDSGATAFGENYVQELMEKIEENESSGAKKPIEWHMIGHLQKNKVKYLVGRTALIHSVDSVPLAAQIEKEAAKKELDVRILLEVNIAREESKFGFDPESLEPAAREISAFPHVKVLGLMTSAPLTENAETNRVYFRELKNLAEGLKAKKLLDVEETGKPVLSMGMTGDYQVAIEEGATMIRVGTAIFGKRNYQNGGNKQ
ncbi:MAG: YggS family pyridoxal phosphate-dependent enzyme [Lachnospiraceae bacterium]|nr:YggS family pyridoxal phosphate-dependent enzyme [Lachnospiraceae bacterium]